jgi:hypothetical protein
MKDLNMGDSFEYLARNMKNGFRKGCRYMQN